MRVLNSITTIKDTVEKLKGKNIKIKVNKGRNKIVHLTAIINEVYPSMFVINPTSDVELDRRSFSYSDVLCGDIVFL
ncbi:MAG: hypothetical protein E7354_02855 [Clostridiales bacterium]|nr:hypothetical protein [Clostridiales bacterium]